MQKARTGMALGVVGLLMLGGAVPAAKAAIGVEALACNGATGVDFSITLPNEVAKGSAIIVAVSKVASTIPPSVSDSAGNSYSLAAEHTHSNFPDTLRTYLATNVTSVPSGGTIEIQPGSNHEIDACAIEVTGVKALPVDQTAVASGSSTAPNSGAATTTQANEVLVGANYWFDLDGAGASTITPGGGYIEQLKRSAGGGASLQMQTRIVSSTGSYDSAATLSSSEDWIASMVTLEERPQDSDGSVTASSTITEPVSIPTTADTSGEAVGILDFTITDGGSSDGLPLAVSEIRIDVSGTADASKLNFRLDGPDVSGTFGSLSGGVLTFPSLGISVADGGSEVYTVSAYYSDSTGLTEDQTVILSTDGDTNFTVDPLNTQMGSTTPVNNGTGSTVDVTATGLAFSTQPAGSVSGSALTTQPVVAARDAFGNTDVDFTETVTLTESSPGTLTNNTAAASSGVAVFTGLTYTATADQESFTLTANDQDGVGINLPTVDANAVTSDVVATGLVFAMQPDPTTVVSGQPTSFTTAPVVNAVDADGTLDTGYSTGVTLAEVNGAGNATMSATGDLDGDASTVTVTPSSGSATFTDLQLTYNASGSSSETFNLRAGSGGLATADSVQLTATTLPTVSDAHIAITGATGNGGAFKVGDTVTASWDNTVSGDDNSGITSVTVDFSQFGGGAAVTATDSGGVWTATYTVVAGTIDATNRNVSVTASNSEGSTTTADTTNATVDNVAPILTDANIGISGATGTGGAYRIGDTVTAAWNDTAVGDNNSDTISDVTVDFSAFGGGAAVAATNSSDTWTATYTIVAGSIEDTNRNVSVSAKDDAGNTTTTADSSNATVDNIQPAVSSVGVPADATYGEGQNLDFTVNTSENVTVNTAGGTPQISLTIGATTRQATYISGSGTSALVFRYTVQSGDNDTDGIAVGSLSPNGGTLRDGAGNDLTTTLNLVGATSGVLVDAVAPSGHSVSFDDGTINATEANATSFTFAAAEEDADYSYTISSNGGGTPVTGSGTIASAGEQISGIDVSGLSDGTLTLSVTLTDPAGNAAAAVTDTATLDSLAPTPALSSPEGSATNSAFTATIDFGETVSGFAIGDVAAGNASLSSLADEGGGTYSVLVTPNADGEVTLDIAAGAAQDGAGNDSLAATQFVITYDATPPLPVFSSAEPDPSSSASFDVSLDFGEAVTGVQLSQIDAVNAALSDLVDNGAGNYGLTVTPDSDGTVTLDYATGQVQDEAGNDNQAATQFSRVHDSTAPATPSIPDLEAGSDTGVSDDDDITRETQPIVQGTADADTTVSLASDVDGALGSASADGAGNWSFAPAAPLSEGGHSLTATASDEAGNESAASDALELTIDTTPPDGHGASFDDDPINADAATAASFSFSGAEVGAGYSYTISSDGGGTNVTGSGAVADAAEQITGIDLGGLADGTLTLSVVLSDMAGNQATPVTATATLSTAVPEAPAAPELDPTSDTGPSDSDGITADTMPTLTGIADGGSTVTIFSDIDGELGTAVADGGGHWSFTLDSELTANASHAFTVTATDTVGNESDPSPALSVTIDTEVATVTAVGVPADGVYGIGAELVFSVSYDEAVVVDTSGGTPQLELTVGGVKRYAQYAEGGRGATGLLFTYTVQPGVVAEAGITLGPEILLAGGRLVDMAGNDVDTTLNGDSSLAGVQVDGQVHAVPLFGAPALWLLVLLTGLTGWAAAGNGRRDCRASSK